MSTTKASLLKTIHQKCMDCSAYQPKEIQLCPSTDCSLWPFLMGKDPFKTSRPLSEAQKAALAAGRKPFEKKKIPKAEENIHSE